MNDRKFYILFLLNILLLCSADLLYSQVNNQNDSVKSNAYDLKPEVNPWGRFKLMIIETNDNIGVTDAGSRFGLIVKQRINKDITLFGGIELSIFLTSSGDFRLSPDNSSNTGFLNIISVPSGNLFGLRKGYVGADFKKYGRIL